PTHSRVPLLSLHDALPIYAHEHGIDNFDEMIPEAYKPGLSARHDKVASIPSFATGTSIDKLTEATDEGYFILKLKIGAAGTQEEDRKSTRLNSSHVKISYA